MHPSKPPWVPRPSIPHYLKLKGCTRIIIYLEFIDHSFVTYLH